MGYEMGFLNEMPNDKNVDKGWFMCGREYAPDMFHMLKGVVKATDVDEYTYVTNLKALDFINVIYNKVYHNADCVRYLETYSVDNDIADAWFLSLDIERKAAMASCFYYDGIECEFTAILWEVFKESPLTVISFMDELRVFYAKNQTIEPEDYLVYFWESY